MIIEVHFLSVLHNKKKKKSIFSGYALESPRRGDSNEYPHRTRGDR